MAQLEDVELPDELMDQIQYVLAHGLVASPSMEYGAAASAHAPFKNMAVQGFSQPQTLAQQYPGADMAVMPVPASASLRPSASILGPDVISDDLDNLNAHIAAMPEQMWRSASMSSLSTDIFMEQPDVRINQEKELAKRIGELDSSWIVDPWTLPVSRSGEIQAQILQTQDVWSTHAQYRSLSATTSSSASGRGDASRVSTSPEHPLATRGRHTSPSNSSSSAKSGSSLRGAEVLGDPNVKNGSTTGFLLRTASRGDEYDSQKLMLSGEDRYGNHSLEKKRRFPDPTLTQEYESFTTNMGANKRKIGSSKPQRERSSQGAFKSWKSEPITQKNDSANQLLLRRCIKFMNLIPEMHMRTQSDVAAQRESESVHSPLQGPGVTSSPETVANVARPFPAQETRDMVQEPLRRTRSLQGGPRVAGVHAGSIGLAQAGHDEAARNHMMAERRRRNKQKENFATLRRLVPIISKADKASILGDAILYLKDLEQKYNHLEQRYEDLERRYGELEAKTGGTGISQPSPER